MPEARLSHLAWHVVIYETFYLQARYASGRQCYRNNIIILSNEIMVLTTIARSDIHAIKTTCYGHHHFDI